MNKYIEDTNSLYSITEDGKIYHHSHLNRNGDLIEGCWVTPQNGLVTLIGPDGSIVVEKVEDLISEAFA